VTSAREGFGPRLRIARERAGVTLEQIAEATKIKRSLLFDLENGNVSRWPKGIYRRAFFRDYLAAIGITSESLVGEFVQWFPDDEKAGGHEPPFEHHALRLTFADRPSMARRGLMRALAAGADLVIIAAGAGVGWAMGFGMAPSAAVSAISYFSIMTIAVGQSGGARFFLERVGVPKRSGRKGTVMPAPAREPLHIVARGSSDGVRSPADDRAQTGETPRRRRAR
jgi:transcriptional regulator with XRE-family HTH domain